MAHQYYHHTAPASAQARAHSLHPPHPSARAPAPMATPSRHRAQPPVRAHITHDLDPVLAYHSHNLPLDFDVSFPPAQIILSSRSSSSSSSGLSPRHLSAPAVSPPVPFMRIKCSSLPWPIDVHPSTHSGSGMVTVGDVLEAIYRGLRHHVGESEWHAVSRDTQDRVRNAYIRRCKRQRSHRDRAYEESQGLRRVDWLHKNTMFQGLSPGKSSDHWIMHLRTGEKMVKFAMGS